MKSLALTALAALFAASFAGTADAHYYKGKKKKHVQAERYATASERQRQNTHAFENGGYYERIQSAHVFGSRGWWELQNRGGGRR